MSTAKPSQNSMTRINDDATIRALLPVLHRYLRANRLPIDPCHELYGAGMRGLGDAVRLWQPGGMKLEGFAWAKVDWAVREERRLRIGAVPLLTEPRAAANLTSALESVELWRRLYKMPAQHRQLLGMLYRLHWTQKQVAKFWRCSEANVSQLHAAALARIAPIVAKWMRGERIHYSHYRAARQKGKRCQGDVFQLRYHGALCIVDDCERRGSKSGLCLTHYRRLRNYGRLHAIRKRVAA